ncbi:hypothetical protein P170DRAFT_132527 [Aspergillus steynii IBT 23096]|uniref:Uncharacterized protein n=1 Tax=Aspergillus steynii IBT 23096 TaxID=1392250 RepID=A0A2I2FQH9_9EURO|nr:uncharacterized protein P170DRAFT_132527 [Aspergillus steynii IBT 23096]PLB42885.1 hypothetical protein P170DRAFT_132527 [Aspergillus steynii IBT 23096]
MLDSLVRVSRRVVYNHYASVRAEARSSVQAGSIAPPAIRCPEGHYIPGPLTCRPNDAGPPTGKYTGTNAG